MMGCVYFIVEPIILDIFPNCGGYALSLLRAFHATCSRLSPQGIKGVVSYFLKIILSFSFL